MKNYILNIGKGMIFAGAISLASAAFISSQALLMV